MQNPFENHDYFAFETESQEHENFRKFRARSTEIKIMPANAALNVITKRDC